jgi:hypothetical protein
MTDPVATGSSWLSFFSAAFSGAAVAKFAEIIYAEVRRRADRKQSATKFLDNHIDPLLKTAMRSLANCTRSRPKTSDLLPASGLLLKSWMTTISGACCSYSRGSGRKSRSSDRKASQSPSPPIRAMLGFKASLAEGRASVVL